MAFMYNSYFDYLCPLNIKKPRQTKSSNNSTPKSATEKEEAKPKPKSIPRPAQLTITIVPPEGYTDRQQNEICERLTKVKIFIEMEEKRIGRYQKYNGRRGENEGASQSCGRVVGTAQTSAQSVSKA
ncbi:hypothetical protein M7I_3107 [Glarea lozoyensis 74030]|uniref:Uncharacterized protein n=1 Tax=Glarea lozoyensis (strain ATCC 74030 / MF5533) TaxID=1104152 RepID=H0EKK9_GLAL7|nr:hypothetical protein M7I_3107 [Glarea lozoyensis 74030]